MRVRNLRSKNNCQKNNFGQNFWFYKFLERFKNMCSQLYFSKKRDPKTVVLKKKILNFFLPSQNVDTTNMAWWPQYPCVSNSHFHGLLGLYVLILIVLGTIVDWKQLYGTQKTFVLSWTCQGIFYSTLWTFSSWAVSC